MKFGTGIGIVISCIGIALGATMEGEDTLLPGTKETIGALLARLTAQSLEQLQPDW